MMEFVYNMLHHAYIPLHHFFVYERSHFDSEFKTPESFFVVFRSSSKQMLGYFLKIDLNCFLSRHL
jgi:hypothetical protein